MTTKPTTTERAIGFRVEPSCVHWAVVDGPADRPVLTPPGKLVPPQTFTWGQTLSWYIKEIGTLCRQYKPAVAWIRTSERSRTKASLVEKRSQIEGVIAAITEMSGVRPKLGALASITAQVGPWPPPDAGKKKQKKPSAKEYLAHDDFREIDWSDYGANEREAILVAVAALQ
jgi:hypothetical protein